MGIIVLALRCYLVFQNVFITFKTLKPPPPSSRNNGQPSVRALTQRKRDMKGCMAIWIVWCCLALYESLVERIVWVVIPFYDELKSVVLIFLILSRARSAEPIYLHVIRPLLKPYVSTLDAVLNFVHNLGDFVLLILSLPFSAAISWWYGPSTDEDQTRLTEADTESVRSYGDEHPATSTSKLRSDYPNQRNPRASSTSKEAPRPGVETENGHNTYPRGVSRETRNPSDTLHSRFYTATDTSQNHQIWYPPSSYADANEVRADNATSVPPMTMPEPQFSSIDVDDWRAYPPFPSAYPSTPVRPPQANMPEPVHPSQFCAIEEEGTGGPITSNDQTDGARQGFGRSLLPLREPSNLGSDGDLSDEIKNLGVQIHETHYVTSSDNDEDMDDYETEEDSFDVTFQTPRHMRILRAVPMGREVSNTSIITEATIASSVPSEATGLTTDHQASSLHTGTVTISRSTSMGSSSAAGAKRPLPHYKSGIRPRLRTAENRSPRKVRPTRGTGHPVSVRQLPSLRPASEDMMSEDTMDDDDLKDIDAARGDDALLARKRRRVIASPKPRRIVTSRPVVRATREVSQRSESRLAKDGGKSHTVRLPVATKTSLRKVNPLRTTGATSSGSTASPRKSRPTAKRNAAAAFRP